MERKERTVIIVQLILLFVSIISFEILIFMLKPKATTVMLLISLTSLGLSFGVGYLYKLLINK